MDFGIINSWKNIQLISVASQGPWSTVELITG